MKDSLTKEQYNIKKMDIKLKKFRRRKSCHVCESMIRRKPMWKIYKIWADGWFINYGNIYICLSCCPTYDDLLKIPIIKKGADGWNVWKHI